MVKRALLVGCNYPGTKVELHGCVNDVRRMHALLTSRYGFDESDILVLVDTYESGMQPTGVNIRSCLAKLIRGTEAGDVLVLHYSGHGTQVPPEAGEAADDTGAEEAIVPTDMNLLTDDDFRDLVNQIPPGATFTFISDSCHSGGLIDAEKEQIGDNEGGGGGLFGMVANAFQGSSEGRDFDYGGQRRRNEREEEELGEDEEPGYGRRRRGGYGEQEEGYEGRQESEYEGYGERREGYGGRRESEYEGYGRRREPEAEGYGGRRESEFEGYGGRRGPEYEGYGGRRGNIQGGGARPAICRVRAAGPPPLVTFTSQPRLTAMSPVRDCDEACRLLLETHHRSFILQTVTTFMKQRSCNVHEATFLQRS